MNNIILIGMPGAGKSTVGIVLAKKLGYSFIDSDLVIQERENMLLHDIISKLGIDGFNRLENEINCTISPNKSIIATGGSAVYGNDAMAHFSRIGTIVYLSLPYEEIDQRLGDLSERGVTIKEGQTLMDLYNERLPLYQKYAHITIDCHNKMIRDIVNEISSLIK